MDATEIASWVGAGGLVPVLGLVYRASAKFSAMSVKVDTMWDFIMRRAMSEAVNKGIATLNSPLVINSEAKALMAPLRARLQEFYLKEGQQMSDADMQLEIERRFGADIVREVCIPHNLHAGACLLIAVSVAKEGVLVP